MNNNSIVHLMEAFMDHKPDDCCEVYEVEQAAVDEVQSKMLPEGEVVLLAEIFKVLGDPTRIRILQALSQRELCVCDLAELLGMSQSAVSHQLRVLRTARLVRYHKEGKMVHYSLDDQHVTTLFNQGLEHVRHLD